MSDDRPTVTQQYAFAVGEDGETDDGIEPAEESVETDLEAFGADVDHREQDSRLDQPEASSFGVDDRPEITSTDAGEQGALFADTTDDQQTLTGERAASQCLFETDESDDNPTETVTDEPTDAGRDTHEASTRAVADGGRVEDDETDPEDADAGKDEGKSADADDETDNDRDEAHAETADDADGDAHEIVPEHAQGALNNAAEGLPVVVPRQAAEVARRELNILIRDTEDEDSDPLTDDVFRARNSFVRVLAHETDNDETDDAESKKSDESEENHETEDVIVAIPRMELAGVADALDAERETIERNAGEGPKTEQLARYVEECRTGLSILDDTDDNGTISRVAAAGAADELQAAAKTNTGDYAEELQRLAGVLRRALDDQPPSDKTDQNDRESGGETMTDGGQDTTFDADEETVTDAWEGAYLSAQWGYDQTNVELAQIVEVSESGKTVLARLVAAERVGHGRTSEQLRPTAEQYGDEFRLHVRSGSDADLTFRGSYPLGSDGDMDDGPTRRGWFYPFNNDPESSIRETRTGFGH
jgi:hypothetical protein